MKLIPGTCHREVKRWRDEVCGHTVTRDGQMRKEHCRVPEYGTKCAYKTHRWRRVRTVTRRGAGSATEWPPSSEVALGDLEREVAQADYRVEVRHGDEVSPYEPAGLSQYTKIVNHDGGVTVKVARFGWVKSIEVKDDKGGPQ